MRLSKTAQNMFAAVQRKLESHGYSASTRRSVGTFPPDGHWHGGCEILLVRAGHATLFDGESHVVVRAGLAVMLQGQSVHLVRPLGDSYLRSAIHFVPEFVGGVQHGAFDSLLQGRNQLVVAPTGDTYRRVFWATQELNAPISEPTARSLIQLILSALADAVQDQAQNRLPGVLSSILEHMASNPAGRDSIEDLSNRFFVGDRQIHRLFRKYLKCSPQEYWRKVRMQRALELLPTSGTIEEVAQRLGFSSRRGFEQAFKRLMGISPGEYRRRAQMH